MNISIDTVKYVVKKDDNLWNIVKSAGFPPKDWEKILNAKYNEGFRKKLKKEKRTADKIFKGDVVYLPAYNKKDIDKQAKKFRDSLKKIGGHRTAIAFYKKEIENMASKSADYREMKTKRLPELIKKMKYEKEVLDSIYTPDLGDRMWAKGLLLARHFSERGRAYADMERELIALEKELADPNFGKSSSSTLKVQTRRLNGIVKALEKTEKNLAKQAQEIYNDLENMSKKPY